MKASEARDQMNHTKPGEMKALYDSIKWYARLGRNYMTCDVSEITDTAVKKLQQDGYSVERVEDFREGDYYKIEW